MICGSSTRSEPAAALRGLAKRESPRSSRSAFRRSNARRFMTVSPRTSKAAELGFDAQRQGADGARVFGDVLAHRAVAARHRLHEPAVAVVRRHGKPVQFQLGHVAVGRAAQQFAHAAVEIAQLAFVQGVVQAQHGGAVADLDEALARLAAHALGGRIRRRQLRDAALPARCSRRISASYSASVISGWSRT